MPEASNDVHALARQIYRKHKQAIDLIIEHRERYEPNYVNEGFQMIREAVRQQPLWREGTINHPYARFVSADWQQYEELLVLWDWPYSLLQFNIHVTRQRASLTFFLAWSEDETLRKKIFERVKANPDTFNCSVSEYTGEFITLHTVGEILQESDYANWWDEEGIRRKIARRLDKFAQGQFPEINRVIAKCLEEYRSENG